MKTALFACFFAAWLLARAAEPSQPTARQVIRRIQEKLAVAPPEGTVDTFKAGNPDEPVTGIAVTMMATYDVLERAAAAGDNLVITHEPTFYNHQDTTAELASQKDPVLEQKERFIADHHLIVWRFHDTWHEHRPDGILAGMTDALGWQNYAMPDQPHLFHLPSLTLKALAAGAQQKLGIRVPRVVGDPNMEVSRVALLPGAAGSERQIRLLEDPGVEVLVIGEAPEWETVEYVADAISERRHKGLVILGHIPSEQAGMDSCSVWLRSFIHDVRVDFIAAHEPFWSPK